MNTFRGDTMSVKKMQEGLKKYKEMNTVPKLRDAIRNMCCECMGGEEDWIDEVKKCTSLNCPLYYYRPKR